MKVDIEERILHFKQPAGTSRGVYTERKIWLVKMTEGDAVGIGECAPLPKLSCDDIPNYVEVLRRFCDEVERSGQLDTEALRDYPSMLFGLETAMLSLMNGQRSKVKGQRSKVAPCQFSILTSSKSLTLDRLQASLAYTRLIAIFNSQFSRGEVGIPINYQRFGMDGDL